MILSVISDWDFVPKFAGNENMSITLHQLSGVEELKLGVGADRDIEKWLEAVVVKIKEPIELDFGKGKPRKMKAKDIGSLGALKDLYYEVLIEYGNHTNLVE